MYCRNFHAHRHSKANLDPNDGFNRAQRDYVVKAIARATAAAVGKGVWLRPFRDLVYTMPPYICPDEDIARICMGVAAAVDAGTRRSET